ASSSAAWVFSVVRSRRSRSLAWAASSFRRSASRSCRALSSSFAALRAALSSILRLPASLNRQPEQGAQSGPQNASGERRDQPEPPVQASGGDAAKVNTDVAAVGEASTIPKQEATNDRGHK